MEETIEYNLNNGGGKEMTIRRSRCTLLEPEVLEDCNVVDYSYIVCIVSASMTLRANGVKHGVIM